MVATWLYDRRRRQRRVFTRPTVAQRSSRSLQWQHVERRVGGIHGENDD